MATGQTVVDRETLTLGYAGEEDMIVDVALDLRGEARGGAAAAVGA